MKNIKTSLFKVFSWRHILSAVVILLLVGGVFWYEQYRTDMLVERLGQNDQRFASTTEDFNTKLANMDNRLSLVSAENSAITNVLQTQQGQSSAVQEQIGKIYDTATSLDKLSKTDPQLLEKYSKVYFLNENYTPAALTTIDPQYVYEKGRTYQFLTTAYPFLKNMINAAASDGSHLIVISSYRSFGTQAALKSSYNVTYGAGTANQFSADQGYSEHQLGTALDFTTPVVGATFSGFDTTAEYAWLRSNAYKYGFILSYPANNTYYEYEPWHWRFVGVSLATKLHDEGKNFYDLDQRVINDYLLTIFD